MRFAPTSGALPHSALSLQKKGDSFALRRGEGGTGAPGMGGGMGVGEGIDLSTHEPDYYFVIVQFRSDVLQAEVHTDARGSPTLCQTKFD